MVLHEYTGEEVRQIRLSKGLSQTQFWSRFETTQSGGSRYESGRDIPAPVQLLLNLALQPKERANAMFDHLQEISKKNK